jgi:hypothetical protein
VRTWEGHAGRQVSEYVCVVIGNPADFVPIGNAVIVLGTGGKAREGAKFRDTAHGLVKRSVEGEQDKVMHMCDGCKDDMGDACVDKFDVCEAKALKPRVTEMTTQVTMMTDGENDTDYVPMHV